MIHGKGGETSKCASLGLACLYVELVDRRRTKCLFTVCPQRLTPSVISRLPSEDAVMISRDILSERIKLYGLQEKKVKGDGNCQVRMLLLW